MFGSAALLWYQLAAVGCRKGRFCGADLINRLQQHVDNLWRAKEDQRTVSSFGLISSIYICGVFVGILRIIFPLVPKMVFIFRGRVCSPKTNVHYEVFGRLNTWLFGASLVAGKPSFDSNRQNTVSIPYHVRGGGNFQTRNPAMLLTNLPF